MLIETGMMALTLKKLKRTRCWSITGGPEAAADKLLCSNCEGIKLFSVSQHVSGVPSPSLVMCARSQKKKNGNLLLQEDSAVAVGIFWGDVTPKQTKVVPDLPK